MPTSAIAPRWIVYPVTEKISTLLLDDKRSFLYNRCNLQTVCMHREKFMVEFFKQAERYTFFAVFFCFVLFCTFSNAHAIDFSSSEAQKIKTVVNGGKIALNDDDFSIHLMMLGSNKNGDSIYIKAGETDILIDAGSERGSPNTTSAYIDRYCKDGSLEYVIVTHADADHIYGFVGSESCPCIFERYECKTIIQFARTNKTTAAYKSYCEKRDAELSSEKGSVCYTALQCYNQTDGAKRVYDLTGDGRITMEILYQKYYETHTSNENDFSVCVLFTCTDSSGGKTHYYFLGDLEKNGEASLVESNPHLPRATFYKGGHHGSYTAASEVLLSVIQPQVVCISCSVGSTEYTKNSDTVFPALDFIKRISLYTEDVYCTQYGASGGYDKKTGKSIGGYEPMNGNIVFICTASGEMSLVFSHNDTKLKDSEWGKMYRAVDAWKKD